MHSLPLFYVMYVYIYVTGKTLSEALSFSVSIESYLLEMLHFNYRILVCYFVSLLHCSFGFETVCQHVAKASLKCWLSVQAGLYSCKTFMLSQMVKHETGLV